MHPKRAILSSFPLLLLLALPAAGQSAQSLRDDYDRLQHWRFRTDPVAVPAGGVDWTVEGATWRFESGRFWLEEPTAGGAVTGLVFEGKGRFQMAVPDAAELAQLRRFARRPDLAAVDEPFTALVLRTSREMPLDPAQGPAAGGFAVNKLARDRHEQWLTQRSFDADARVVEALATPGDRYLRADMKTGDFGWLAFDYDAQRMEEIRLESFNTSHPAVEVWVSLDRPSERDERGRPTSRWDPAVDVEHFDIVADLTEAGRDKDWMKGKLKVGVRFLPRRDGARAVQLYLHHFAKVTSVSEGGKPLPFLRDHIGDRRANLDGRLYDASLIVLLDQPLAKGVERRIDLDYELDVLNFAPGRNWYPSTEGDETFLRDEHTARLELKTRRKFEVRANGRRQEGSGGGDGGGGKTSTTVWIVDHPVKMLTFTYADYLHEERVTHDGVPDVICFGSKVPLAGGARFREVGEDVIASLAFYQQLFDAKLPDEPIYVSSINAGHGQAFDGFIQLSHKSFDLLGPGIGELFRAHEAAHQLWGVMVGAASYRDAWLGEAFAEYSGMMFVEKTMKDGPRFMAEIIHAYDDEQNGSIKSGFSKFTRMDVNKANLLHGDRIGPIGHGWRADTGEVPTAYGSQVYGKGALVLHMLRGLLRDQTGSDQAFLDVLRDFLHTYRGQAPSTGDFEAVLARHAPGDWSWFFDEWVNGMGIPAYRWSYEVASSPNAEGRYVATLKVRQSDVPAGFKMSVPVAIEYPDGRTERRRVMVDGPEESFPLALSERPKGLTFNADSEVLSKTRRE